jgi:hypothetical protein
VHRTRRKKGQKKRAPKAATSGPVVRVNSHVAAITVVIFTTKLFFSSSSSFFYSYFVKFFIHSFMRTAVHLDVLRNSLTDI